MSGDRVEREHYPDGTLQREVHYRGTLEHGPWREWHPNGVLAKEFWFDMGRFATGVNRTWSDKGVLLTEKAHFDGMCVGRVSVYNEDGSLQHREYRAGGRVVWRELYDELCEGDAALPRYTDPDPPLVPAATRVGGADAERSDALIRAMLKTTKAEARRWLRGRSSRSRTLGEMTHEESRAFVERAYEAGAVKVIAVELHDDASMQTTNHMIFELPHTPQERRNVFAFEREQAGSQGFEGEADRGQRYVYLKLC